MGNKLFTEILENAPANEPERQFYFIEQIKALLDVKKGEGYEAKAMVTVIGCQMSAKDGEKLQGILQEAGYSITENEEEADVSSLPPVPSGRMPTKSFTVVSDSLSISIKEIRT